MFCIIYIKVKNITLSGGWNSVLYATISKLFQHDGDWLTIWKVVFVKNYCIFDILTIIIPVKRYILHRFKAIMSPMKDYTNLQEHFTFRIGNQSPSCWNSWDVLYNYMYIYVHIVAYRTSEFHPPDIFHPHLDQLDVILVTKRLH